MRQALYQDAILHIYLKAAWNLVIRKAKGERKCSYLPRQKEKCETGAKLGAAGQSVLHRGADPRCVPIALAFATFENVCYLIQNGADRFSFIFFRGFGTGAMHVLCGLIVGGGLAYAWRRTWLKVAGTCGLLGAAITLHAIYNLLIAYGGAAQYIAYALPVLLVAAGRLSVFRLSRRK